MSWRDRLRRVTLSDGRRLIGASFRGVPFLVEQVERTGGRRIVTHEFPGRDDPFIEDLGRRARSFRVNGYVIGEDYLDQRDALQSALEDVEGPGELVHPYYGVRLAIGGRVTVRETTRDGGQAFFAIQFADAPAQVVAPTEQADLEGDVASAADSASVASEAEFVDGYDVTGQASFALEQLSAELAGLSQELGDKLAGVVAETQSLARLSVQVRIVTTQAASLVRQPSKILGSFLAALEAVADEVVDSPGAVWQALVDAYDVVPTALVSAITATRVRERANQEALSGLLRRGLLIEAARRQPRVSYGTISEAVAARQAMLQRLDEQAATAGDATYATLIELRSAIAQAVPGDAVLARIVTIEQRTAIPSLVLAHRLYGSVERESDILSRNRIRHPGFLMGDIEVLSNG